MIDRTLRKGSCCRSISTTAPAATKPNPPYGPPFLDLALRLVPGDPVALLDLADELILLPLDDREIVLG